MIPFKTSGCVQELLQKDLLNLGLRQVRHLKYTIYSILKQTMNNIWYTRNDSEQSVFGKNVIF